MDWINKLWDLVRYLVRFVISTLPLHFFIWWQNNNLGPFIFDSQGFICEITAQAAGIILDNTLGGHYFYPALTWLVGSIFYILVWGSLMILAAKEFFVENWSFVKNSFLYLVICSVIIAIYYFHILDKYTFFSLISINKTLPKRINEYFITAMVIGIIKGLHSIYIRTAAAKYGIYED